MKGVAERDLLNVPRLGIVEDRGIDVILHGHIHFLPWLECLPIEAETVNLVEIDARLLRLDIEGGDAGDRPVRQVLGFEESQLAIRRSVHPRQNTLCKCLRSMQKLPHQ